MWGVGSSIVSLIRVWGGVELSTFVYVRLYGEIPPGVDFTPCSFFACSFDEEVYEDFKERVATEEVYEDLQASNDEQACLNAQGIS